MSHSAAVRYLRDYVAIPSLNPMGRTDIDAALIGEERYARCVQQQLGKLGVDSVIVGFGARRSVVAELRRPAATETLLVASHLDTVPVDNMSIDPFDPRVQDGRLYGRGSCDTKAGMAAMLAALERVLARGSLARNLILVGEADEESSGSIGVADVLAHLGGPNLGGQGHGGRGIDWALATEPTGLRLVNAHKGTAVLRVEARGHACHSSDPARGRNAIVLLARAIAALERFGAELGARPHAGLGPATLSIGLVGGGQAPNIVPDRAWLAMDRRTLPGDTSEKLGAEVEQALRAAGVEGVEVADVRIGKEPLFTAPDHVAVQHCLRALERAGERPELCSVAFGTDAGQFGQVGIPSVVLGPGSIEQAHTEAEYVEIDQLERMVGVFEQILEGA